VSQVIRVIAFLFLVAFYMVGIFLVVVQQGEGGRCANCENYSGSRTTSGLRCSRGGGAPSQATSKLHDGLGAFAEEIEHPTIGPTPIE
jgi:hypothetical protein